MQTAVQTFSAAATTGSIFQCDHHMTSGSRDPRTIGAASKRVDGAHVDDHGPVIAAKPALLGRDGLDQAGPPAGLVGRVEAAPAAVLGKRALVDPVGDDDDLVHLARDRADLRNDGGEQRMRRIELLGDEDDPCHRSAPALTEQR